MKKDIINTFSTKAISIVLSFGNSIFLTRILGVEGKGEIAIFIASLAFFAVFLSLSMQPAIIYYGSKKELNIEKLFNSVIVYSISIGLVFFLCVNFFAKNSNASFFLHANKSELLYQVLLTVSLVFTIIMNQVNAVFSSIKKFSYLNGIQLLSIVLGLLFYSILYVLQNQGYDISFKTVMLFYCLVIFLNFSVTIGLYLRHYSIRPRLGLIEMKYVKLILSFAFIAYIGNIAQFLNYRIDLWFVDSFAGVKELGLYSLASNFSQLIWILPQSIALVLLPYTAASGVVDNLDKTLVIGRICFLTIGLFCLFLAAVSQPLIEILYGAEFSDSVPIFRLLLFGVAPFCLSVIYASFLAGIKKHEVNMKASILGLIATITLDLILIPKYGGLGAAIASSLSYIITTAYVVFRFSYISKHKFCDLVFVRRSDLRIMKNMITSVI